jgi:LAO/AO transport system kinase
LRFPDAHLVVRGAESASRRRPKDCAKPPALTAVFRIISPLLGFVAGQGRPEVSLRYTSSYAHFASCEAECDRVFTQSSEELKKRLSLFAPLFAPVPFCVFSTQSPNLLVLVEFSALVIRESDEESSVKIRSSAQSRVSMYHDLNHTPDNRDAAHTQALREVAGVEMPAELVRLPAVRRKGAIAPEEAVRGILAGDRVALARAITLVESRLPAHREAAANVLRQCLPHAGKSVRIGITGVPGAGKSTFIEHFGKKLCDAGRKLAVLAVDPSSAVSGGSILGDKTRMEKLAAHPSAFIRPSPAGGALGGVAAKTREAMLLCEAAGYDTIFIETVGVGQSEIAVRTMTDFFLLLQIAGAGDELQGIKKGVIEMSDAIVVTKADGENLGRAQVACGEYGRILHYLTPFTPGWAPKSLLCSALDETGLDEIWTLIGGFCGQLRSAGVFEARRREQNLQWFRGLLREAVLTRFFETPAVRDTLPAVEEAVAVGTLPVAEAIGRLLS